MEKIIYATDGSEASEKAAHMAKDYLKAWPKAELIIVYVTVRENYAYDLISDVVDRHEKKLSHEIETKMKQEIFAQQAERLHYIHEAGHAAATICRIAAEQGADLIMMGSHGRGFVNRALIGSVAHGVLSRADRPVLVVQ